MKRQYFLIAALVALTQIVYAQLSIETNLGAAGAYTDATDTRYGPHLGVRLDYAHQLTPTTQLGVFIGGFGHRLRSGSFVRNEAYGELGMRLATGSKLQFFGEAGVSSARRQFQGANVNAGAGLQYRDNRSVVYGAKITAQRNIAQPDALDGVISGNSDIVITPQVFVRVPLFKKQRQRNQYKTSQPQPNPVQDIPMPQTVQANPQYEGLRNRLLNDSVFGNTILTAINLVGDYKLAPVVKQIERQDSILFLKQYKLEQRVKIMQEKIDTQQIAYKPQPQPQTEWFGKRFYFKTGDSTLSDSQIAQINQYLDSKRRLKGRWHITASTSNTGQKQANQLLAFKRADGVKAILPKSANIEVLILNGNSANVAEQYVQLTFVATQ